jgi:hypothetical protein
LASSWIRVEASACQAPTWASAFAARSRSLMGRSLANNITNLLLEPAWSQLCKKYKFDLVIVNNITAINIPVGGRLKPII